MIDIAICDDDCRFVGQMEEILNGLEKQYGIKLDIDAFQDGASLLKSIEGGCRYDVICLDIRMNGLDGLETARRIRRLDRVAELIYITSYDSYMKDAFEASPSGFITKPIDRREFEETFCRIIQVIMEQDAYYRFRYKKEEYKVPVRDILYFVSDLRQTHIVCMDAAYAEYKKLSEVSKALGQMGVRFLRIHRSYLVNYRHIARFSYGKILLTNGEELSVSVRRRQEIDEQLKQMMVLSLKTR